MQKNVKKIIVPIIIFLAIYIIFDYVNIPWLIGIKADNINIDVFGILFDSAVVISLYAISFYYIDNRQIEKDSNAKNFVNLLIKKTYQQCFEHLEMLDNRELIKDYIIPKVDGNKPTSENKVISNIQEFPFATFDTIIDLAASGYVEKDIIASYLDIKKEYQFLINMKIILYDLIEPETDEQWELYNNIQSRDDFLKKKLEYYIAGLNTSGST